MSQSSNFTKRKNKRNLLIFVVILMFIGVTGSWLEYKFENRISFLFPEPTPLPGWRTPTDYLFLNEKDLPDGWQRDFPGPTPEPDPTINANSREFYKVGSSISVYQIIWRAYTVDDAQEHYLDRRKNEFRKPKEPVPDFHNYCEFLPPEEVTFKSEVADEFYLACGTWDISECEVLARYRNYVTILRINIETECNGEHHEGLSYSDVEGIIKAMDSHFEEFLIENPLYSQ